MHAVVFMSLVTSFFALLTCVYTMANNSYPEFLRQKSSQGSQFIPVLAYVLLTVCAAITLWETWKNNVGVGGGGGGDGY